MSGRIPIKMLEDDGHDSYYASEGKIYPREVTGRLDRLRKLAVFWLLGMFYVFPWLSWPRRSLLPESATATRKSKCCRRR